MKKKSMLPGLMIMAGVGLGAYMIYKKNPNIMCDMRNMMADAMDMVADGMDDISAM